MSSKLCRTESSQALTAICSSSAPHKSWSACYGERHRFRRIEDFPVGIAPPRRVRIYQRGDGLILQWWDPQRKGNVAERITGDLVNAISRARQIEEQLMHFRTASKICPKRLLHTDLVAKFLEDQQRRADAGELCPATVCRYEAALGHYLAFCAQPEIARAYPQVGRVNRDFRLDLAAFLAQRHVTGNGRSRGVNRPMKGQAFILDTVRALFEWAADPDRGHLLPLGFHNPFLRPSGMRTVLKGDPLAQPDITQEMASALVSACDWFQLRLFTPLLLFGLRASEPCFLFGEYVEGNWIRVPCNLDLGYATKGRRDKRFPLHEELGSFWDAWKRGHAQGILYQRRSLVEGVEKSPPLAEASLEALVQEYQNRCAKLASVNAARMQQVRTQILKDAGGLTYDHIQAEFSSLACRLRWPSQATLKDLRHLFATTLHNAAMPEGYRRYLMGQSPGRAAIVAYTHLSELRRHYEEAVRREWGRLLDSIRQRFRKLETEGQF